MIKHTYGYEGPVVCNGTCLSSRWSTYIVAESKEKAKIFLAYRYKVLTSIPIKEKIYFPGEIILVED